LSLQYVAGDVNNSIISIPSSGVGIANQIPFGFGNGQNVLRVQAFGSTNIDAIVGDATAGARNGVIGVSLTGLGVSGQIPPTSNANTIAVYGQKYSTYAGPGPGAGGFDVNGLSAKGHGLVGPRRPQAGPPSSARQTASPERTRPLSTVL
jgi:hypothetical protein